MGTYGIKPVIGIGNMWKDGKETEAPGVVWNVVYSYDEAVMCENPNGEEWRALERIREKQKERMSAWYKR